MPDTGPHACASDVLPLRTPYIDLFVWPIKADENDGLKKPCHLLATTHDGMIHSIRLEVDTLPMEG